MIELLIAEDFDPLKIMETFIRDSYKRFQFQVLSLLFPKLIGDFYYRLDDNV